MSERTRGSHTSGTHHEVRDLADLHASKTQEALRHSEAEVSNTDLSSASIQSMSVVRLSARPEKRKVSSLNVATTPGLESQPEQETKQRAERKLNQSHGILKNPYFLYKGGLFERFITLLANLLKYLERSLLASLRPQAPIQPPHKTVIKTKRRDASGREIDEDNDRSEQTGTPLRTAPRESN
jgi:hypothetical protein